MWIAKAYGFGSVNSIKESATLMRTSILNAFENNEKLPWATTAEYLQSLGDLLSEIKD